MIRRWWLVAVVAACALLAPPASAQSASIVASQHTDFGTGGESPPTLTRTDIEGSGDSASVTYDSGLVDSFEDGTLNEYSPLFFGASTTTEHATDGQRSFVTNASGFTGAASSSGLPIYPSQGTTTTIDIRIDGDGDNGFIYVFGAQNSNNDYRVEAVDNGSLELKKQDAGSISTLSSTSIPDLPTDTWIELTVVWEHDGDLEATLSSPGLAATTSTTDTDYTDGRIDLVSNHDDGPDGINSEIYWDDIRVNEQPGQYLGANHSVANISSGWTNLTTVSNTSATVIWQEDGDKDGTWTNVTTATYTTPGNYSADLTGTTSDRWRVRVDTASSEAPARVVLADEGVQYIADAPTLSNADPSGPQATYGGDISIDVADADFPTNRGDSVTVTATNGSGTQVGTTTITTNQTVTFTYSAPDGKNQITWNATDSDSLTTTTTQSVGVPGDLVVYNESSPTTVVSPSTNVTATFFRRGTDDVYSRNASTGQLNLSGLPPDAYTVSINASGYGTRQTVISDTTSQHRAYLLPASKPAATIEFQLNDQTGRFPTEGTTLVVERPLTRNGVTSFEPVYSDQFGATDTLRVDLRDNIRYRIKVRNANGETRVLESYTTAGDAVAPLPIGQVQIAGEIGERGVAFDATVVETDQGRVLRVVYRDPEQQTDNVTIGVEYNGSDYVPNTTGTGTYGRYITTVQINNSTPSNATYIVSYEADRGNTTIAGETRAGAVGDLNLPVAALPLSLLGWMLTVGFTSMVVIRSPRLAPATGTATASMLTIVGVLSIPAAALGISGAISVLAVAGRGGGQ